MILIINSIEKQCGVYQYGLAMFKQLTMPNTFEYVEVGSQQQLLDHMKSNTYEACILNYHKALFPWWSPIDIKTYYIYHEDIQFDPIYTLDSDPTRSNGIPRPVSQVIAIPRYNKIPTFGSFGFGFETKGFERIISIVQSQYDIATIRLLIPFSYYGDQNGARANQIATRCRSLITKQGIKLLILHDFLPETDLVHFLASNDLNIFLYDQMLHRGCSSVFDYALAAKKPIAISDCDMFRHVYSDQICAYKRSLSDIIKDGDTHILPFLKKWNPSTLQDTILKRIRNGL